MLPKETLLGRYSIEKKIGEGGFGIVYLAKDTRIERKVAIKTIASDSDSSEFDDALRLFLREIQAIAKLDHPHILPLYDFGETTLQEANYTYMVMPYREEGTLGNWLKLRKDNRIHFPSLEDVAYILDQAADALQQAHNHNILHLDVKPSNFLIRNNKENPNRPYLLLADFGIAKFVNTSAELTKVRRGTPYYMPPEQWDKNRVPEPASDQYALAVTIYQLLTYKQVFEGYNDLQVQNQHLNEPPTPPSTLNPLIPPEIDAVILTALAKDSKKRYPTITAFADAFKQALVNNASTRVILSISKTEAETGGSYPLKLSDGRQITVAVPAGVQDGQEIRQEGLGIPTYDGGPSPALIITIIVKLESESERKIAAELQSLQQELQALRAKPSSDPKVVQQIQQLSKEVAALQKQAANGDQSVVTQLQKLAKDVAALHSNPNGNQDVLKQLQQLSQAIAAITPSTNNQGVTKQLQKISQDIASLQPVQNDNQAIIDKLQEVSTEINKIQTSLQTEGWSIFASITTFFTYMFLIALVIVSSFGLYYGYQAYTSQSNIQATAQAASVATSIAFNNSLSTATTTARTTNTFLLPQSATLNFSDSLDGVQNKYGWDTNQWCNFTHQSYHAIATQPNTDTNCIASSKTFNNFVLEVNMIINSGDCGGVIFRADRNNNKYYLFQVCQTGETSLSTTKNSIIYSTNVSFININLNHSNLLTILSNSNQITLYVNTHLIDDVTDTTYSQGQIGLWAFNKGNSTTDVSYTNLKVWTL